MPAYASMTNASFLTSVALKNHLAFALGGLVATTGYYSQAFTRQFISLGTKKRHTKRIRHCMAFFIVKWLLIFGASAKNRLACLPFAHSKVGYLLQLTAFGDGNLAQWCYGIPGG